MRFVLIGLLLYKNYWPLIIFECIFLFWGIFFIHEIHKDIDKIQGMRRKWEENCQITHAAIKSPDGRVWIGKRHGPEMFLAMKKAGIGQSDITISEQGFISLTGIFLNREDAAQIVILSKQIKATKYGNLLYSEDLW